MSEFRFLKIGCWTSFVTRVTRQQQLMKNLRFSIVIDGYYARSRESHSEDSLNGRLSYTVSVVSKGSGLGL